MVDSAFSKGRYPFLLKLGQKTTEMYKSRVEVLHTMNLSKEATSMRQSVEWGMCAI